MDERMELEFLNLYLAYFCCKVGLFNMDSMGFDSLLESGSSGHLGDSACFLSGRVVLRACVNDRSKLCVYELLAVVSEEFIVGVGL